MLTSILEEAVNGWTLTVYGGPHGRQVFIYERLVDAQDHRRIIENGYEYDKKNGVQYATV
jgi:hypothetical protein